MRYACPVSETKEEQLFDHAGQELPPALCDGEHVWHLGNGDHWLITAYLKGHTSKPKVDKITVQDDTYHRAYYALRGELPGTLRELLFLKTCDFHERVRKKGPASAYRMSGNAVRGELFSFNGATSIPSYVEGEVTCWPIEVGRHYWLRRKSSLPRVHEEAFYIIEAVYTGGRYCIREIRIYDFRYIPERLVSNKASRGTS